MTIQRNALSAESLLEQSRLNDEGETLDLFGAPVQNKPQKNIINKVVKQIETKSDITSVSADNIVVEPIKTAMVKLEPRSSRRNGPKKSSSAMKTISEVATLISVPQHVLRFWETKFKQVRPMKRGGGRRYYRPDDVQLIERIHHLLYNEGYTIKGVQRLLKVSSKEAFLNGDRPVQTVIVEKIVEKAAAQKETAPNKAQDDNTKEALSALLNGLKDIRAELG